jgi:hypothetical protein
MYYYGKLYKSLENVKKKLLNSPAQHALRRHSLLVSRWKLSCHYLWCFKASNLNTILSVWKHLSGVLKHRYQRFETLITVYQNTSLSASNYLKWCSDTPLSVSPNTENGVPEHRLSVSKHLKWCSDLVFWNTTNSGSWVSTVCSVSKHWTIGTKWQCLSKNNDQWNNF